MADVVSYAALLANIADAVSHFHPAFFPYLSSPLLTFPNSVFKPDVVKLN